MDSAKGNVQNRIVNPTVVAAVGDQGQLQVPLMEDAPGAKPKTTPAQKVARKTFKNTAHLANLLPTGSVLAFQVLSPLLTHQGNCRTTSSQFMALGLVGLCGLTSFLLCFTDSFRDSRGKVRYGVATSKGLWVIDGSAISLPPEESSKYSLCLIDVVHAFMSFLVFMAVALFDQNVLNCLCPEPSEEARDLLTAIPVAIGFFCSAMFVLFPSKRHGIGFPLSRH